MVIATFLQATSRPFLMLFTVSLFLLALTHGFQIFEVLIGVPDDTTSYSASMRQYVWSLLHQFAFGLHSFSLFMFSLERYITVKYSISQSARNRAFSIIIGGFISVLSMVYAQLIHLVSIKTIVITCLNLVDMAALVVLLLSSKFSIKHYKNTAGIVSLETRFQISDVYIWTQALIPAACLAFLLKFTYVLVIWLLHTVENSMTYQIAFTHFFQNALDLFTVCIPFLVITNHRRLSQGRLRNRGRVNPGIKNETHVKTLDGKSIRMKGTIHDHFDFLKNHWK